MYRPSELFSFLNHQGLGAKKSLSQNFLIDGNIVRKIIAKADIQKNDVVIEIGPGPGALTELLLETGARVIAVEKDQKLARALCRLQTEGRNLTLIEGDVLDLDLKQFVLEGTKAKVVSNLPYHLTTPILTRLLPEHTLFSSLTLMMQEEVAKRVIAKPATPDYGSLSLFCHFFSKAHLCFSISPRCFFPVPKVRSAIVHFQLTEPPKDIDCDAFFQLTRKAFQKRRKMLKSSLKDDYPGIAAALESLKLNPLARPEELSLEEFIRLQKVFRQDAAF